MGGAFGFYLANSGRVGLATRFCWRSVCSYGTRAQGPIFGGFFSNTFSGNQLYRLPGTGPDIALWVAVHRLVKLVAEVA
jgi:hypothetical protein